MLYTLDPLGLMMDTSGTAAIIVPVPEVQPPEPETSPEAETIRPEDLGSQVDISV